MPLFTALAKNIRFSCRSETFVCTYSVIVCSGHPAINLPESLHVKNNLPRPLEYSHDCPY